MSSTSAHTQTLISNPEQLQSQYPLGFRMGTGSKMGNVGTGTVLDFGTPRTLCTRTAVSWVFTG